MCTLGAALQTVYFGWLGTLAPDEQMQDLMHAACMFATSRGSYIIRSARMCGLNVLILGMVTIARCSKVPRWDRQIDARAPELAMVTA